ncbi:MAG: cytochrome c oxidase subunit II [Bacteroidetes bacterium]|jgi:cytochrome c oxidase subunit 2|nr:cytochrome c oxidase subunit II [Bacteroidota bacterium]
MHYLIYFLLILAAAAIWQLVRVVELSSKLKGIDPNKVTESDNRLQGRIMLVFYFALMAFFVWQIMEYKDRLLPVSGSVHGAKIDWLMDINLIIVSIVFVVTNFLLFYMGFKYYGRDGQRATFVAHNNKLEMIWTGVPAVVLFVIIFLGIRLWNDTMSLPPKGTRMIEIYAQQFNFKARYSGKDNVLGKSNYLLINDNNELGLDSTDATGYDDFISPDTIFLPVDEEVDFEMRSRDVIHSAYFPHFRAQMNVVPGMQTYFHFNPRYTTEKMRELTGNKDFDYILLCNKICGVSHFNMQLKIVVGTRAEFDVWTKRHVPFYSGKTPPSATAQN